MLQGGLERATVRVLNLLGRPENVRFSLTPDGNGLLHTGSLSPGIYLVHIHKGAQQVVVKLVRE